METLEWISTQRKVRELLCQTFQPLCRAHGLNQTEVDVLLFFANYPSYNTARDLCTVRGIKPGLASVAVEALVEQGLLQSQADPADRRLKRLSVTPKAAEIIHKGRALLDGFAQDLLRGISSEDLSAYQSVTRKLLSNMDVIGRGGRTGTAAERKEAVSQ